MYTPHTAEDIQKMLERLGLESIEELFQYIPKEVRLDVDAWDFPEGKSEGEALKLLRAIGEKNRKLTTFIGLGVYDHEIPSAVWALAGKAEFVTSYTPYQAEASQGMLQAIFEYQSMICEITGMDVANASVYDGATALAEAMIMAVGEKRKYRVAVSEGLNPLYREVLSTYANAIGIEIIWLPLKDGRTDFSRSTDGEVSAFIMQQPNFLGFLEDTEAFRSTKDTAGALGVVSIHPILNSVLRKPSEYGADIVCGEGQSLGIPLSSGGPNLGFMAATKKLTRKLPGRIVGATTDEDGRTAYVLTLQAREQHIRREKASSNICTNQALNALAATIYIALLGPHGLREVAHACINNTHYLADRLKEVGVEVYSPAPFLMEFPVRIPKDRSELLKARLLGAGFTPPVELAKFAMCSAGDQDLSDMYLLCCTEKRTKAEIDAFVEVWREIYE